MLPSPQGRPPRIENFEQKNVHYLNQTPVGEGDANPTKIPLVI